MRAILIFISLMLAMHSCCKRDNDLHRVKVELRIENKTNINLQCIYDGEDYSISDSLFNIMSSKGNNIVCIAQTTIENRDDLLTDSELEALISKFEIFYVEQGDTLRVNNTFYDGKSYWTSDIHRAKDGIMFIKYYWWCEYTATLTADMFEKK